ncbi:unnamed protein product [Arctogadus glacialis]
MLIGAGSLPCGFSRSGKRSRAARLILPLNLEADISAAISLLLPGSGRAQRALGALSGTAAAADTPRCPPPGRIGLGDVGRRGSDWWETERK